MTLIIRRLEKVGKSNLLIRTVLGRNGGTWLNPKLAVAFARWLDDDFGVLCDAQIDAILRGAIPAPQPVIEQSDPMQLMLAQNTVVRGVIEQVIEVKSRATSSRPSTTHAPHPRYAPECVDPPARLLLDPTPRRHR